MMLNQEELKDLLDVGATKAVGYLPLSYLYEIGVKHDELFAYAKKHKLRFKIINSSFSGVGSGSFYFWDKQMLEKIIEAYRDILLDAHVPVRNMSEMIFFLDTEIVDYRTHPQAYLVVGKMFNDYRFREVTKEDILRNRFKYTAAIGLTE